MPATGQGIHADACVAGNTRQQQTIFAERLSNMVTLLYSDARVAGRDVIARTRLVVHLDPLRAARLNQHEHTQTRRACAQQKLEAAQLDRLPTPVKNTPSKYVENA